MKTGQTLIVFYSSKPDELRGFYELLGLKFQKERHGTGPEHFACDLGEAVLEIYPAEDRPSNVSPGTLQPFQLGIVLKVNRELIVELICEGKILVFRDEHQLNLHTTALTQDPEGRRVELRF
jgi:hypothetical protein